MVLGIVALLVALLSACDEPDPFLPCDPSAYVTVGPLRIPPIQIPVGDSLNVYASAGGGCAISNRVDWVSENASATVRTISDTSAIAIAVAPGMARIRASARDRPEVQGVIRIQVVASSPES